MHSAVLDSVICCKFKRNFQIHPVDNLSPIPFVPKPSALATMILAMGLAETAAVQWAKIPPESLNLEASGRG